MKRTFLFIACLLASVTISAQDGLAVGDIQNSNCLSETRGEEADPMESLSGEWWLVGWNDNGTWYEVNKEYVSHRHLSIEISEEGYMTAYSMVNMITFGPFTLDGNEIHFDVEKVMTTEVYCDAWENNFFEKHLIYIKSYQLDGNLLRLYYTDNDYYLFTKDFELKNGAQTDYFYYSSGNKIPLTLNENKVVVSIPKDCGDITERFLANTRTLDKIFDEYFDIFLILRSDFNKLTMLDFWAEDSKSVILSSCYFTENHEEIYATPYLNVRLKKEEDIDLLTSYAEQYKLNIVKNYSPLMPLWYILAVTPDSGMNTLECANALHESGDFEASLPDFANDVKIGLVYRPFVEDNKVWKVGDVTSGNPVRRVEYYYFEGDTIIDGKTCKQMMCQRYVAPEHPDYDIISQQPSLNYVGAWYEENQKVYEYDTTSNQFKLMYDFSLEDYGTFQKDGLSYVVGRRQTNGIKGFKGVYRDVLEWADENRYSCAPWLEGVGIVYGPPTINICNVELMDPASFLMECYVDDEIIYLNDEYEDGATPAGARKQRIDFTHTIKEKPKTRMRGEEEQSLYGEYNEHQLNINLNPINDAYMVSITDESGNAVYEKAINAASIVGLNIDISKYPEGNYTVTVENSNESFTGEFKAQLTGIDEIRSKKIEAKGYIYNLQGQRLSRLQKGLNIVNGQKIYVKN